MSQWGTKRQLSYIGVFLAVLLALIIIVVIKNVDTTPTCFDLKQNGEEEGVDCGGSCQLVCPLTARNVVVLWERPFKVTEGVYNVTAYFENQNIAAGSPRVKYRFRLYDEENVIVAERTGETFIGPNQRSAIFEGGIQTGNREPVSVFFELLEQPTWLDTPIEWTRPSFIVGDKKLEDGSSATPRLSAVLENITLEPIYDVEVIAILYDKNNNAVATSKTVVSRVDAKSTASIVFTWPQPFDREVVRSEVIPRINIFSAKNK
jgi:hypothetical protein